MASRVFLMKKSKSIFYFAKNATLKYYFRFNINKNI